MEWKTLLATTRLSDKDSNHRNEFDDDYKRIVTSPAFRRLQDKTQVFPLETSVAHLGIHCYNHHHYRPAGERFQIRIPAPAPLSR